MTLAADRRPGPAPQRPPPDRQSGGADEPVEFWPTAAIRSALESGDIATWQRIAAALKRDPYGRTARQVEEVLDGAGRYANLKGVSKALWEILKRARSHLDADERGEVARHVRLLIERSGLNPPEFASRIGISPAELADYLDAKNSPSASLMVRMRRLSDRFVKQRAQRPADADD